MRVVVGKVGTQTPVFSARMQYVVFNPEWGVPDSIKDRVFFPLVSGRDGGSGLGLTLAQTFVQQHHGLIELDSRPGRTDFRILIPLP